MSNKRYTSDEINCKLQQIQIFLLTGDRLPEACLQAGVSRPSYYRWKKQYEAASKQTLGKQAAPQLMTSKDTGDIHDMSLIHNSMFSYR